MSRRATISEFFELHTRFCGPRNNNTARGRAWYKQTQVLAVGQAAEAAPEALIIRGGISQPAPGLTEMQIGGTIHRNRRVTC